MTAVRLSDLVHRDLAVDPEISGVTADSTAAAPEAMAALAKALPSALAPGRAANR